MTKEQLCEYRELQKEIKRLQSRISKLRDSKHGVVADIVKGSSIEFPLILRRKRKTKVTKCQYRRLRPNNRGKYEG